MEGRGNLDESAPALIKGTATPFDIALFEPELFESESLLESERPRSRRQSRGPQSRRQGSQGQP